MVDKKHTFSQTLRKINGNLRKIKKDFIKLLIFFKKNSSDPGYGKYPVRDPGCSFELIL